MIGVKTGHTDDAGWSQVVADEAGTMTIYATILGSPSRAQRNADLESLISWGIGLYSLVVAINADHAYAQVALPYGRKPLVLVAKSELRATVRPGARVDRARRRCALRLAAGAPRRGVGARPGLGRRPVGRPPPADRLALGGRAGRWRPRRVVRAPYSSRCRGVVYVILTVTMNAAFARTITVPNFQRGQRHRASAGLPLAGGKGINVARALKLLGIPVVATGLAGGQAGLRIVERLTGEAILNDFVRIEGESRTTTAVVDPTSNTYTEINEWGPSVKPEELEMLREKLNYLSQGAELVVFAGSLPRDVDDEFYADAIHDLARRQIPSALDCEAEPLRYGVAAEPFLVSPNQREAEALVGQEFHDDEDFVMALDQIAEMGARNVLITTETGCYALLREEKVVHRYRVEAPHVEPVSAVGGGDTLLAAFVASVRRRPAERGRAALCGRGGRRVDVRARRRLLRRGSGGTAPKRRAGARADAAVASNGKCGTGRGKGD